WNYIVPPRALIEGSYPSQSTRLLRPRAVGPMDLVQLDKAHQHDLTPPPVETTANGIPLLPNPVSLSAVAAEKVKEAMEQEGLQDHGLRVGVIGGGCSGLQYLLDFTPSAGEL